MDVLSEDLNTVREYLRNGFLRLQEDRLRIDAEIMDTYGNAPTADVLVHLRDRLTSSMSVFAMAAEYAESIREDLDFALGIRDRGGETEE